MLCVGLGAISAQINISVADARKINETYARLDSAKAAGNLVLIDLKAYQDSTAYFKDKAIRLKRKRNRWRAIAIGEAIYIALSSTKKQS